MYWVLVVYWFSLAKFLLICLIQVFLAGDLAGVIFTVVLVVTFITLIDGSSVS